MPHIALTSTEPGIRGLLRYRPQTARPLSELDLLTVDERQQLAALNHTTRQMPGTTVPEIFQDQVRRTPEATAVIDGDTTLSYAELARRASQVARLLSARGIGHGQLVGVALERSADLVTVLLGAWLAGAGYLPVDPAYPPERVRFMLADAAPAVMVTSRQVAARLPAADVPLVVLDDPLVTTELAALDSGPVAGGLGLADVAYVIYTSGSTGRPKGVLIEQRGVMNFLSWHLAEYQIVPGDRLLHQASASLTCRYGKSSLRLCRARPWSSSVQTGIEIPRTWPA